MQIEKEFFYYYNVFEYIQEFVIVFLKIVNAFLVFEVLTKNVCLYEIESYNFFVSLFN